MALMLCTGLLMTSCGDWFDVTAPSEIRKEDHFSSVTGFQQSLIGCYIAMTDDALYGTNLSWYATELLAHQFNPVDNSSNVALSYWLQSHNYTNTYTQPVVDAIWDKAYNVIANADDELANLEDNKNDVDEINYHVIRGELLAIRAYMHFDLLRLFGYGNWSNRASELDSKLTIPYSTELSKDQPAQHSGNETVSMLLADLDEAANLLKEYDPVTGVHDASYYEQYNEEGFFSDRTLRLNYYAVKALQARVHLWRGNASDITAALAAAEEVINAVGDGISNDDMYTYCGLMSAEQVSASTTSMVRENIFGLNVSDLATRITSYIKPYYFNNDEDAMFLAADDAEELYENSATDVRLTQLMQLNQSALTTGYTPLKVYQANLGSFYKDKISMIRLPELYYIAAECYVRQSSPDIDKALEYLNKIRETRGLLTPLEGLDAEQTIAEIQKEYRKEFLSEGVMFYYYKRTGAETIPFSNGETMGDEQYVLPYPEFEKQSGRVQ